MGAPADPLLFSVSLFSLGLKIYTVTTTASFALGFSSNRSWDSEDIRNLQGFNSLLLLMESVLK